MVKKKRKSRKKIWILLVCAVALLIVVSVILVSVRNREIKRQANQIVSALEKDDMQTVEALLFRNNEISPDSEIADFFQVGENEERDDGLISYILKQDVIEIKRVEQDTIVYEITSPDLTQIFQDIENEIVTEEEFENYVFEYIDGAQKITSLVNVPYTYEDKKVSIEYLNEDFFNAITGNIVSSYQRLLKDVLEEYESQGGAV